MYTQTNECMIMGKEHATMLDFVDVLNCICVAVYDIILS